MESLSMTQPKSRSLHFNVDVLLGMVFLVASAVFLWELVPNYIEQPGYMQHPLLSPRFLPEVMGWIVLVLSLGLILSGLTRQVGNSQERLLKDVPFAQYASIFVALVVYGFGFQWLGAMVSGVAATLLLFAALKVRRPLLYVFAVLFPLAVCWAFISGLNVPLPSGDLW
ncbi:MAG: tripartite tricarboxylate transporter TctB family protein [Pseudomonadota bacterium]|uniref:tripartite tricarboxylate transporter TctB family protein n=1 Tax=Gallaecimonas pentaromativorans TaxID=584787 RepID=UPI00067E7E0C|nr:tripartite tricarboxylate transporter TctB family protein [Gallaecimonas pentaromativorans]MED5525469.1 tripartite tricarboxylate transporter TctB family protein [Pseudomonadota bacterium]